MINLKIIYAITEVDNYNKFKINCLSSRKRDTLMIFQQLELKKFDEEITKIRLSKLWVRSTVPVFKTEDVLDIVLRKGCHISSHC